MPLTPDEIAFLAPAVAEYADVRTGPAWTILNDRRISYQSVIWLMEAYQCIDPPRIVTTRSSDGTLIETLQFGRPSETAPTCPWADNETASKRNEEIKPEVLAFRETLRKERTT